MPPVHAPYLLALAASLVAVNLRAMGLIHWRDRRLNGDLDDVLRAYLLRSTLRTLMGLALMGAALVPTDDASAMAFMVAAAMALGWAFGDLVTERRAEQRLFDEREQRRARL